MMTEMLKCRLHEAAYTHLPTDGELSTLKLYWQNMSKDNKEAQLPWLVLLLLDIKPHAADPVETFMGWIHSARRSQLASKTTTALAKVKMSYNSQKARDRQAAPQSAFITIATQLSRSWLIHLISYECSRCTHCDRIHLAFTQTRYLVMQHPCGHFFLGHSSC